MNKTNLLTWIGLVTFTLLTFYFSDSAFSGKNLAIIVMGIAAIKFLGIGFQFMELKKANSAWKAIFIGFVVVLSSLVVVFA